MDRGVDKEEERWGGKRGWSRGGKRGRRSGQVGEDWTGSLTAREFNRKPAQARVTFLKVAKTPRPLYTRPREEIICRPCIQD